MENNEQYNKDLESDHTIGTLDDFIDYGKKAFGVEITIKKSDNPDTYEKLFGDIKADCISREFQEIVVEYPSTCIYPEYKGKPYFSIKYKEGNDIIIGYGTYNPKVLSEYIRDYFLPSVAPQEPKTGYRVLGGLHHTLQKGAKKMKRIIDIDEDILMHINNYNVSVDDLKKIIDAIKNSTPLKNTSPIKVRPCAERKYSSGNDGRDEHYYIRYSCPNCSKIIYENDIACEKCGTFFDWSKKAYIETQRLVRWE